MEKMEEKDNHVHATTKRGGLRTMPFIFGNEVFFLLLLSLVIHPFILLGYGLFIYGIEHGELVQLMRLQRSWLWWDSMRTW